MNDLEPTNSEEGSPPARRLLRLSYFVLVIFICTVVPIAAAGLTDLYNNVLERNPPIIDLVEVPRGIGLSPVTVKFRVRDSESGLDEAVVRVKQKGPARELQRIDYKNKVSEEIVLSFDGENSGLEEGVATIEVRAFDRSFWSNAAEVTLPLRVDFRKPKVEILSTQHNTRVGGAQMVFYKAFDENLAVTGVKIGNQIFLGYPATGIDKEFSDPALHVALYAISLGGDEKAEEVKLFAEDKVGNVISTTFYNKISDRPAKESTVALSEEFMREKIFSMAELGRSKLSNRSENTSAGERIINDFIFVNEKLRRFNDNELLSLISKSPRHEAYWTGPFLRQPSTVQQSFGVKIAYTYGGNTIGNVVSRGEELILPRGQKDVLAVSSGIVVFAQDLGIYGWAVGIDHGLGVVSIYGRLSGASVPKGADVQQGQVIGEVGQSGFARNPQLYFEMRVQGVPVDPNEWSDVSWFYSHILGKINDLKKMLGIPVYIPLERGL